MSENTRNLNVTFPADLHDELKRLAPPQTINQIIVEATADYVRKLKSLTVLKETAGAWDDSSHPDLATPEDIDRWIAQIRSAWRRTPIWEEQADA